MRSKFLSASINLFVLYALTACQFQVDNSQSNDEAVFGDGGGGTGGVGNSDRFSSVKTILRRNCASCHSEFGTYSETQFVTTGYVVAQAPGSSALFTKLRNAGYGGNMPPAGALTPEEISAIREWIMSLSRGGTGGTGGGGPDAATRRQAAFAVLNTKCKTCHMVGRLATSNEYSGRALPAWGSYLTDTSDNNFVLNDMVFPGFPNQSWLYRALKTYGDLTGGVGKGFELMPVGGAAITAQEEQAIREWILGIGNP